MILLVLISLLSVFSLAVLCAQMSWARPQFAFWGILAYTSLSSLCYKSLSIHCVSLLPTALHPNAVMSSDTMRECDPLTLMHYPTSSLLPPSLHYLPSTLALTPHPSFLLLSVNQAFVSASLRDSPDSASISLLNHSICLNSGWHPNSASAPTRLFCPLD